MPLTHSLSLVATFQSRQNLNFEIAYNIIEIINIIKEILQIYIFVAHQRSPSYSASTRDI